MNYIVYDLEFNQKYIDSAELPTINNFGLPFEIIQIGALKLNESLETISTFNALIRPEVYPVIHPYVKKLTGINDDIVSSCKNFAYAFEDFLKFIGDEEIVLCVWGIGDIKELLRNIKFYNLSAASISRYYIDIQKYASKRLNAPKGSKIGLSTAISFLGIPTNGKFHDALNDAYYTAEAFKIIYDNTIKPAMYVPDIRRRVKLPKEKIDFSALMKQFEKMYNREMSPEEKSIIRLAYLMGKTRQFTTYHE